MYIYSIVTGLMTTVICPQSWLAHTQSDTPSDVFEDRGDGVSKGQLRCGWSTKFELTSFNHVGSTHAALMAHLVVHSSIEQRITSLGHLY